MNRNDNIQLDPEDWDEFARLMHRAVDDIVVYLRGIPERPVWQTVPPKVHDEIDEDLPRDEGSLESAYESFRKNILPYPTGNIHPRFWGWVMGTGTADGVLAEMLAAAMNAHVAGYDQSATLVERQVIRWMAELFGYAQEAGGLLVSGGTVANLTGLLAAHRAKADFDVRSEGLQHIAQRMLVYGSTETHSWAERCCDFIGLGKNAFRKVPVDNDFRIDLTELRKRLDADIADNHKPFCIIGNAGTVNTGAIDDLHALADLCEEYDLWFHVDGALGGLAVISPELRSRVSGIDRADSIAFDLHKWAYLQYEIGCVLVRDNSALPAAFASEADYLVPSGRGILPDVMEFARQGMQLSRGFRALKAWIFLKTHGVRKWAGVLERNIAHITALAERIKEHPSLELLASVQLNVVCFRFTAAGRSQANLDDINKEILLRLQDDGIAVISGTRVNGRYALRAANTNHRSRWEDFEILINSVLEIGKDLIKTSNTS